MIPPPLSEPGTSFAPRGGHERRSVPAVGLKDAERRLRWLAAVVILNVVLSSSYQDALFLTYHRKQAIPPAMLVGSLLTALTTLGLNRLLRKLPAAAALRIILFCLGALTLVAAGWNVVPSSSSTLALFLFTEVATTWASPPPGRISKPRWRPRRSAGSCRAWAPGLASVACWRERSFRCSCATCTSSRSS